MSPRRRVDTDTAAPLRLPEPRPRRSRLALVAAVAGTVLIAALVTSAVVFGKARTEHQREIREAAVLSFVRSFVTQYTSPDPFHANDYAEKILAMGTGQFAKLYDDKMNEVVLQVARSEPGVGTVQELGVEQWNDDGSANVVVVSSMVTTMPDGRKIPSGSRWVVTASKEGEQWKVSNLIQVV
ncbi:MAG: mammalian cell entry protein [Mycobacterium sp.]|jgi:Mce-associated membrane protein